MAHGAAAAAAHGGGHGVIEHAVFIKLMHITVGSIGGLGLASALGGYTYIKCGPYRRVNAAKDGEPDKEAGEEVEKAVEDAKKDDDDEEEDDDEAYQKHWNQDEREAFDLMTWTIGGATLGCGLGLVSLPFVCKFAYGLKWSESFYHTGLATAFFAPFVGVVGIAGPRAIAKNLPQTIATTVSVGAMLSLAAFPIGMFAHGHEAHQALYYLAACRVAASGVSAVCAALFAQRYADIQMSKRRDPKRATGGTDAMNWVAIRFGQIGGNAIAGAWMFVALTDWAGMHYPHWMHELPEVYFLCTTVHLLAPSPDHDNRAGTLMARSGMVALHALLFIPDAHSHVMHNVQIIIGQAITAGWFGTFAGEWRGKKYMEDEKAKISHHEAHEGHEQAEHVEAGEQGADFLHHMAHALAQ